MREVYEEVRGKNLDFSAVGRTIPDPFFETKEQHNLIGVANVFLDVLFHRQCVMLLILIQQQYTKKIKIYLLNPLKHD